MKKERALLQLWQERLQKARAAYAAELGRMAEYEALYRGTHEIDPVRGGTVKRPKQATSVRNVVAELVEAEVSSDIPTPKVTPQRKEDEQLAKTIEDYLRDELDRLPFERINDQDERTTPVHGGDLFLVEWDSAAMTHTTRGALSVRLLHPKQFIPQPGVYEIPEMDYLFVQLAQTKEYIKTKYGKDVGDESEEEPDARSFDTATADDMVTENIGYFKNESGGIGRVAWCNDVLLEYMDDYQARRVKRCPKCDVTVTGDKCPHCGTERLREEVESSFPKLGEDGIPMERTVTEVASVNEMGMPEVIERTEQEVIPYYKPDVYPVVLRRNVSRFGSLLGVSDVEMIRDQQMALNKLTSAVDIKLLGAGSYVVLPKGVQVRRTDEQLKVFEVEDPAQKSMIDAISMQPDISKDMAYISYTYQAMREQIGITDSFQGRADRTATSGTAKEFSAAQAAGRLESKRVMKNAAYADLFEVMFKFLLAYSDEPRPLVYKDPRGARQYGVFDKMDFLKYDDAGELYWDDEFLFSVDQTAPLAGNREALWQEARANLEKGCFGNPTEYQTLVMFWTIMEGLHYPLATEIKQQMEQRLQEQEMQMAQQAQMQQMGGMGNGMPALPY